MIAQPPMSLPDCLPHAPSGALIDADLYALARQLGDCLSTPGWRVSCAESCTGGWIAEAMTAVPGSSAWFDLGLVTYSNAAKQHLLKVPAAYLDGPQAPGAVSEQTVLAMV